MKMTSCDQSAPDCRPAPQTSWHGPRFLPPFHVLLLGPCLVMRAVPRSLGHGRVHFGARLVEGGSVTDV